MGWALCKFCWSIKLGVVTEAPNREKRSLLLSKLLASLTMLLLLLLLLMLVVEGRDVPGVVTRMVWVTGFCFSKLCGCLG